MIEWINRKFPATSEWNRTTVYSVAFVAVMFLSELPLLIAHFHRLWLNEHYCYFPLILGAFAVLVYKRWPSQTRRLRPLHRFIGYGSLLVGFVAFVAAV